MKKENEPISFEDLLSIRKEKKEDSNRENIDVVKEEVNNTENISNYENWFDEMKEQANTASNIKKIIELKNNLEKIDLSYKVGTGFSLLSWSGIGLFSYFANSLSSQGSFLKSFFIGLIVTCILEAIVEGYRKGKMVLNSSDITKEVKAILRDLKINDVKLYKANYFIKNLNIKSEDCKKNAIKLIIKKYNNDFIYTKKISDVIELEWERKNLMETSEIKDLLKKDQESHLSEIYK